MYPALTKISVQHRIIGVTAKLLKLFKLSLQAVKRKQDAYGVVNYIEKSIKKEDVVINIGSGEDDYLYIIRRKLGRSGKIIVFESRPYLYQQLTHLKNILKWSNVELESLVLSEIPATKVVYKSAYKVPEHGAVVINIDDKPAESAVYNIVIETLDNYCKKNNLQPSFLKIDGAGNEFKILKGAMRTIEAYKPKILLKCEERLAGAQNILETFTYLQKLGYNGYFVLDAIQIPIVNFDFNLYQNTYRNFYCNNFMFE
jgi:FkbM family methyltransferase